MDDSTIYCPICQRNIYADNVIEVEAGEHDGYIFTHDDIEHDGDDFEALEYGVN